MSWLTGLLDWVLGWFKNSENEWVKTVRETTVTLCGFLPTVETAAALIAVNLPAAGPSLVMAVGIAKKICAAITSAKTSYALAVEGSKPVVDGVVIEGEFTK